jgi:DmsE family decaheme c-type cytochrome
MNRRIGGLTPVWPLALGVVVWLTALAGARASVEGPGTGSPAGKQSAPAPKIPDAAPASPSPKQAKPAQPARKVATAGATYAGDQACLGCHDQQQMGYERSAHHQAADPRTPAAKQGCESCHGPGSLHVADADHVKAINDFKVMTPAQIDATCAPCHNRGLHALWDGSPHERRDVSCVSCHSQHKPLSDKGLLKAKTETEICATCHRDKAAKQDRSGHMPLREGKMACSTCHNPHGSTSVKLLRKGESIAEMCTSCHADKRGPYLFEHAPTRDGCVTCHDPHGSSNERMLVVKTPMLCQRCHVATRHPSTIYDQALITTSVRVYARSCVTCHASIHGSSHPSGRFFIR